MGFSAINGNLVLVDDTYDHRWHDAWGNNVSKYVPSNGIPTDDTTGEMTAWIATETGTNTTVNSVTANSLITMVTGATDFNGYSSQVKGSAFKVATAKPFYFGGSFSLDVEDASDFLFGLCGVDTTLTAASTTHAIAVSAGGFFFSKLDTSTSINFHVYSVATEVTSIAVGTMDNALHTYEVYFDGEYINVYFDSALVGRTNTSLPTTVATPSISVRNGASAAVTLETAWLRFIQAN
jgi:hypothetical protein